MIAKAGHQRKRAAKKSLRCSSTSLQSVVLPEYR
jgi:hypothetical protein